MRPDISIILYAKHGHSSVRAAIDAWEAQTCRHRLELIVLCPDAEEAALVLGPRFITIATGSLPLHEARAAGVRAAAAAAVIIAEDHCLPEPDCAEWMLARLAEGWDTVGPSLRPGTTTAAAEASFLLGYGEWMPPVQGGPVAYLPGHNAVMQRAHLISLGERLADSLLIMSFFMRHLQSMEVSYYLEPKAQMVHYDPPDFSKSLIIFYCSGLGFGAVRSEGWSWPGRWFFASAFPAIAAAHWIRACRQQLRCGGPPSVIVSRLLSAIPPALAWGIGESIGALLGRRRVEHVVWRSEVKPLSGHRNDTNPGHR